MLNISTIGILIVSCNGAGTNLGAGNTLEAKPVDKQVIVAESAIPLIDIRINTAYPITTMINLDGKNKIAWNYQNGAITFNYGTFAGKNPGNVVNMVKINNSGDVVLVDNKGYYYAILGCGQTPNYFNIGSMSAANSQPYYPLATDGKGYVYYARVVNGVDSVILQGWNSLSQNASDVSWNLQLNDTAEFIDSDKYDDLLVVSTLNSSNSGIKNFIYYTQYRDPNLYIYKYSENPITTMKLTPMNYQGNVIRIAFWAEGHELRYTNINSAVYSHNPNQPVHSINLPSSDTGYITKIDVDSENNDLFLTTSTGNVYVENYSLTQNNNNSSDYSLSIIPSNSYVYTTGDESDPITAFTRSQNDSFFIGTQLGKIYAYLHNF